MTATIHATSFALCPAPLRRALQAAVATLLVAGVIGAGVALATSRPVAALAPGTARLLSGDAAVTVHRNTPVAAADALLRAGDTISVSRGVARLRTAAGLLHAGPGSSIEFTEGAPRITRGDVLLEGQAMKVMMRAARAEVDGVARVRQGLSLEVGVYRGGAVMHTAAETFGLPRLRRAIVAGLGGPSSVTMAPLALDGADAWDRKFLGDALELDAALTARSRGLTAQLAGREGGLIDQVAATAEWSDLSVLRQQPIGEFVVAAELSRAAELGPEAVAAALKLRADGASWGLIALEQGVRSVPPRFSALDSVVVPSVGAVTEPTVAPSVQTVKAPAPVKVTVPKPTTTVHPPVTVPPAATAEPGYPVGGVVDGVDNLLGGLLGGLTGK